MANLVNVPLVLLLVAVLAFIGFWAARLRARASVSGETRLLHSRPVHHGWSVALATSVPSFAFLLLWVFLEGFAFSIYAERVVSNDIPDIQMPVDEAQALTEDEIAVREGANRQLFIGNLRILASALDGFTSLDGRHEAELEAMTSDPAALTARLREAGQVISADVTPAMLDAAQKLRQFEHALLITGPLIALVLAVIGFGLSLRRISAEYRARNVVERWVLGFLIAASTLAILTTMAILAAITIPSLTFFREYGLFDFLLGLQWAPAGDVVGVPRGEDGSYESALGFLPLIWGTLYISVVALLVAVPLGLFAAIYLSEFASKPVRAWVKPALEILAGVPTIVYGLFALITVGPFLQSVVGATIMPNTVSVVTAGVVMGMMLVPFVSSLSDDVINAVPQALRDGSLGLGATPSETVTKVILPAALPGIVGAIVLAASRAIGETMIVVLAAGALSNVVGLEANPFGAVVTVTTRIVAVLTGEASGFDSIDVLAVFALAFTLFFITLGLNLLAQRIVRKYREQYD